MPTLLVVIWEGKEAEDGRAAEGFPERIGDGIWARGRGEGVLEETGGQILGG